MRTLRRFSTLSKHWENRMTDEELDEEYEGSEEGDEDEGGASEELIQLAELHASIEQDIARLKSLHKKGKLQGEVLSAELVSTVLPLLLALAGATTDFAGSSEEWAESVDETLDALESGGVGGTSEAQLDDSEVQLFAWLFVRFKETIAGMQQAGDQLPPEVRKGLEEIDSKLNTAMKVLQRVKGQEDDETGEETADSAGSEEGDDDGGAG